MRTKIQRFRWLADRLPGPEAPDRARRIAVLLGARQVGKTTLARSRWPDVRYVNLDAAEDREALRNLHTAAWGRVVGEAVLDEAQKEPSVFDKVKYAFDAREVDFTALLGSSRLLLLKAVRESLAGRTFLFDLWPLMPSEIRSPEGSRPTRPLWDRVLQAGAHALADEPPTLLGSDEAERLEAWKHLERWGGMPELLALNDEDRREWLRSYQRTWLEHDLRDLARLSDLEPFRTLQRLTLLRTGQLLSYSNLARDAGVGATTARRYLELLRVSYQMVLLQPFRENLTSSTVKAPKVYPVDLGLLRQTTGQWGPASGALFEALVITEAHKWCSTAGRDTRLTFYRTRSGLEVDLLAEEGGAVLAVEVKSRARADQRDLRPLRKLQQALGPRWRGGLVVTQGGTITALDPTAQIWSVPAHRLFG